MQQWQQYYRPPNSQVWRGRTDSTTQERIHQWIKPLRADQIGQDHTGATVLIGFACDEGVKRNHGRPGAAEGPQALRQALANICLRPAEAGPLYDLGDIVCPGSDLEGAQEALGFLVAKVRSLGARPLVIGGGHETAWGHYQGLSTAAAPLNDLAIINFDAHFDLRPFAEGASSGTPFRQIASARAQQGLTFDYTCLGIQSFANSSALFATAQELGVHYVMAEDMVSAASTAALQAVDALLARSSAVYVSLCLDVLSAAVAPGVSAIQPWGLMPWHLMPSFQRLFASGQVVAFDVVELAPPYDSQNMTARQAAYFIAEALRTWRVSG